MHRNVLLHGSARRDRVKRKQSFRYRCFGNALPVQLLLRRRHVSHPMASAFRVRSTGDPDSGCGFGVRVKLDIHISCRSDHVSPRRLYILFCKVTI
jgi:hypothetical protein